MTTLPISGISLGDCLSFHGIAQHKTNGFKVYVAPDYLQVIAQIHRQHPWQSVIIVYDQTVPDVQVFVDSLNALVDEQFVCIPVMPGEQLKTLEQVTLFTKRLNDEHNIAEQSLMFIIGGGTVCNFAGYIAADWNGMEFVVIPTNYTAIGDVAIGSLHMINLGVHKNRLQLYSDPLAVVLDPVFMKTLPKHERRHGLVETMKHAMTQDGTLFVQIETHIDAGTIFDDDVLFDFALCTAQRKDELMGKDPFGERTQSIFLYGHVLAHAIESASDFKIPHGEAVAMGLLGEQSFFHKNDSKNYLRTKAALEGLGLPTRFPQWLSCDMVFHCLEHTFTKDNLLRIPNIQELGRLHEEAGGVIKSFTSNEVRKILSTLTS